MIKTLLVWFGGPYAWIASAATSAFKFCVAHWKLVLAAAAIAAVLGFTFSWGMSYEREGWEKKWASRDAGDLQIDVEHERVVAEVDENIDVVEAKAEAEKAKHARAYAKLEEEVRRYVASHSQPSAPGACPTDADIGLDGVQLIDRARRERFSGPGEGN